jgi:hypothetical protein
LHVDKWNKNAKIKRLNFATAIIISKPMQNQIDGTVNASNNDGGESPILDKGKG